MISGQTAAEAITAFAPCRLESDGWHLSSGAAANSSVDIDGYAAADYASGETGCTFYLPPIRIRYGSGLTKGASVFLGGTAGTYADAASTGGTVKIGYVVDATRIQLTKLV